MKRLMLLSLFALIAIACERDVNCYRCLAYLGPGIIKMETVYLPDGKVDDYINQTKESVCSHFGNRIPADAIHVECILQ